MSPQGVYLCGLVALVTSFALAQEPFVPPKAYPSDRYEQGWAKNPFTLKTAPVALEKSPFAQNLAIGTYYGDRDNPTVVIVNTKTRERIPLRKDSPAPSGLTLKSVSIQPSRKNTFAEVSQGSETAVLRFDDSFVRQLAAESGAVAQKSPDKSSTAAPDKTAIAANTTTHDPATTSGAAAMSLIDPAASSRARNLAHLQELNAARAAAAGREVVLTPTSKSRRDATLPSSAKAQNPSSRTTH